MEKFLVFYIGQLQFYLYHLFQWVFLHQSFLKEHLLDFLIMSFTSQWGSIYFDAIVWNFYLKADDSLKNRDRKLAL